MDVKDAIKDQTALAMRLVRHLGAGDAAGSNMVISPLSLHVLLALVGAGSRGATLDQIVSFLGPAGGAAHAALASQVVSCILSNAAGDAGGPRVGFANGAWVDASLQLKAAFAEAVAYNYKANAQRVDFRTQAEESGKQINSWFERETEGLIKELLPPGSIGAQTRLVLGNALYFKGTWCDKFSPWDTRDYPFYLPNGSLIHAPFMTSTIRQFVAAYNGFKVLKLPYAQGQERWRQFSMYIFLPDTRDGLQNLAQMVSAHPELLSHCIPNDKIPVGDFRIPKFKLSFELQASKLLRELGLVLPFCPTGYFQDMVDSVEGKSLHVSGVYHKSCIEVDEVGTEAAAASAAVFCFSGAAPTLVQRMDFVADHPFLFLIREDRSGIVMFAGHVVDPVLSG